MTSTIPSSGLCTMPVYEMKRARVPYVIFPCITIQPPTPHTRYVHIVSRE